MAHAAARAAAVAAWNASDKACKGHACPPVLLQGLAPVLAFLWYAARSRCTEEPDPDSAAVYVMELGGVGLLCAGEAVLLCGQSGGMTPAPALWGLLSAAGLAAELLCMRRVAPHLPAPAATAVVSLFALSVPLLLMLARDDDWGAAHTSLWHSPARWLLAGACSGAQLLLLFLSLRWMHVYAVSVCCSFAGVVVAVATGTSLGANWDDGGSMAVPAMLIGAIGTVVSVWASAHHRSEVEVQIPQRPRMHRKRASGIKGSRTRRRRRRADAFQSGSSDSDSTSGGDCIDASSAGDS